MDRAADSARPIPRQGLSPYTPEGRAAFARWAAAAAARYANITPPIIWECYNEPNGLFWRPQPNVTAYALLALETGKAIRAVVPDAIYVGPATSGLDLPFHDVCYQHGLLDIFTAVSVHPCVRRRRVLAARCSAIPFAAR